MSKYNPIILLLVITGFFASCSPKLISTRYYFQNEKKLDQIESSFRQSYRVHPFSIVFTSRDFKKVSVTIITDTLNYIYNFTVGEERLGDSLSRYGLPENEIVALINNMQAIRCTWISNYNYYDDDKKRGLTFMSIKAVALKRPFKAAQYYVLTYFQQPQYFDSEGQLLDRWKLRRLRKINGEIFKRINDKVCYTVSERFR